MHIKSEIDLFTEWCKNQKIYLRDFFPTVNLDKVYPLDLSINNTIVKNESEFNNPDYFTNQLKKIQSLNPDRIITGGYLEKRALYTSDIYNANNSLEKRNIHLGIDFWLPENTPVHSLFDGKVVCSIHQNDFKGYGGFVILEHQFESIKFYTLYGHLSKSYVDKLNSGDLIKKHEEIGKLGNYEENGKWVPHLHFQIMHSLLDYKDDFPGVVLESEIDFWKKICPNPNLLFKLKNLN